MTHRMTRDNHINGWDYFTCPTCGRRFKLRWPPAYCKVVLEPGDAVEQHGGFKADFDALPVDPHLEPFERWWEGRGA